MASVLLTAGIGVLVIPVGLRLIDQWELTPWWWNVAIVGVTLSALVAAATTRIELSSRLLWLASVSGSVTFPLVVGSALDESTWHSSLYLTTAAAICLTSCRVVVSLALLLIVVSAHLVPQYFGLVPAGGSAGDLFFSLAVALIGYTIWSVLRRAEEEVRHAHQEAIAGFAAARAAEARAQAANQWDAYVHDDVLAGLTAMQSVADDGSLRAELSRVLSRADRLRRGDLVVPDLRDGILEATLSFHPSTEISFESVPETAEPAEEVRLALIEATSEALRNIAQHAWGDGPIRRSTVTVRSEVRNVQIVIADQGRGFEMLNVAPTRLGIQVSIHARMASVGGDAEVRSKPGGGTEVTLRWPSRRG